MAKAAFAAPIGARRRLPRHPRSRYSPEQKRLRAERRLRGLKRRLKMSKNTPTKTAVAAAKKGRHKMVRIAFKPRKRMQSANTQCEIAPLQENNIVKTAVSVMERTAEYAPAMNNKALNQAMGQLVRVAGGKLTSPGGSKKEQPSGASLFSNKINLPQGSTLRDKIQIGARSKLPSRTIGQPASATLYYSEYSNTVGDLTKADAHRARSFGLNEINYELIPIELTQLAYKRMASTPRWTNTDTSAVSDSILTRYWDSPTAPDFQPSDPDVTGGMGRTTYAPMNLKSEFSVTNLNTYLNMNVKVHLVQLKKSSVGQVQLYINPKITLQAIVDNLNVNNKIGSNTPSITSATVSNQKIWGLTDDEAGTMIGRWSGQTVTPFSITQSPTFADRINVIKTINYSIAPGSSRVVEVERFRSVAFNKFGNLSETAPSSASSEGRSSFSTDDRMFLLVEYCGQKDTPYYRAEKSPNSVITDRYWSTALSAPGTYMTSLKMDMEVALERTLANSTTLGGAVYKRSFVDVTNENLISKTVTKPFTEVYEDESSIPSDASGYIFPVSIEGTTEGGGSLRKVV